MSENPFIFMTLIIFFNWMFPSIQFWVDTVSFGVDEFYINLTFIIY